VEFVSKIPLATIASDVLSIVGPENSIDVRAYACLAMHPRHREFIHSHFDTAIARIHEKLLRESRMAHISRLVRHLTRVPLQRITSFVTSVPSWQPSILIFDKSIGRLLHFQMRRRFSRGSILIPRAMSETQIAA